VTINAGHGQNLVGHGQSRVGRAPIQRRGLCPHLSMTSTRCPICRHLVSKATIRRSSGGAGGARMGI